MLTDILDGLKVVASGISSVREIAKAVKTGAGYLAVKHPDVQPIVRDLMLELRKTITVVKQASAVLTNFGFNVDATGAAAEPGRFNDYYIKSKSEAQFLRDHIEDLRTHCSKVRDLAFQVTQKSQNGGFIAIFAEFLNLRDRAQEKQLAETLDRLAYEDFAAANMAQQSLELLEKSLAGLQAMLGGAQMSAARIVDAADLLAKIRPGFEVVEAETIATLEAITAAAKALEKGQGDGG